MSGSNRVAIRLELQGRCYLPPCDRPANRGRRPARRPRPDPALPRPWRGRQLVRRHPDHRLDLAQPLCRDPPVPRAGRDRRPHSRMGPRAPRRDRAMGARPPWPRGGRWPAAEGPIEQARAVATGPSHGYGARSRSRWPSRPERALHRTTAGSRRRTRRSRDQTSGRRCSARVAARRWASCRRSRRR